MKLTIKQLDEKIICPVCDTEHETLKTKNECDECGHFWIVIPEEIKNDRLKPQANQQKG